MKILVINGSPKGEKSGTLRVSKAFIEGMKKELAEESEDIKVKVDYLTLANMNIHHCTGCFDCWKNDSATCALEDDVAKALEKYEAADVIIWSFPLYIYSMPSIAKAFLDRTLPLHSPRRKIDEKGGFYEARSEIAKRFVLISACGVLSVPHSFDSLVKQFEIMYPMCAKVLVMQGAVLSVPDADPVVKPYLAKVSAAGAEFIERGFLTKTTEEDLAGLMIPRHLYLQMSNRAL